MSRHIGQNVDDVATALLPARLCMSAIRLLAYIGIGVEIIIFDTLTTDMLIAMVIAIILTAAIMLVINYLVEYRDWKYKKLVEYATALKTDAESAVKPVTAFSKVYIATLGVSLVLASFISAFITPLVVDVLSSAPEPYMYFFAGIIVTGVMALYLDRKVARAVADGTFKQKEIKMEEAIIQNLEDKFLKNSEDAPSVTMSDEMVESMKAKFAEFMASIFQPTTDDQKKD